MEENEKPPENDRAVSALRRFGVWLRNTYSKQYPLDEKHMQVVLDAVRQQHESEDGLKKYAQGGSNTSNAGSDDDLVREPDLPFYNPVTKNKPQKDKAWDDAAKKEHRKLLELQTLHALNEEQHRRLRELSTLRFIDSIHSRGSYTPPDHGLRRDRDMDGPELG